MASKKTAKKSPAKKSTKAAKKAPAKAAKKAPAKAAKKAAKKATKKAPAEATQKAAKKAPAKATQKAAKKAPATKAGTKRAAAKKQAAPAATTKAGAKSSARKATAKQDVAQSKTAPSSKKPVIPADADHLRDKKWLAGQREALLRERESYTSSADRLAAEAAALMADREPGDVQFDEESGEGDTIAVERDRDLALSAAARQSVSEIDAALARLDDNTYGLCVAGDDVIPRERLEAIPEASVCVTHKTSMF